MLRGNAKVKYCNFFYNITMVYSLTYFPYVFFIYFYELYSPWLSVQIYVGSLGEDVDMERMWI